MEVNDSERDLVVLSNSETDRTARILSEGLPSEIIAEIEMLEQQNTDFNDIVGISDADDLDAMVADFCLEFPDFDIFKYVDPALDAALDSNAADVLDIIDCEIRQPDFNLNLLASGDAVDDICIPSIPQRYDPSCHREANGEIQSLKSEMQQMMKEIIGDLQQKLATPTTLQQMVHRKQFEEDILVPVMSHASCESENRKLFEETQQTQRECNEDNVIELLDDAKDTVVAQLNNIEVLDDATIIGNIHLQQNVTEVEAPYSTRARPRNQSKSLEDRDLQEKQVRSKRNYEVGGKRSARHVKKSKSPARKVTVRGKGAAGTGYECGFCGKRFNYKCNLTTHLRIHTGEKPFKCKICDAAFTQSSSLTHHSRIHTGEKLFKCQICDAAFTGSGDLTRHSRIHTDKRPFPCRVCNAAFRQSEHLRRHLMIHLGEKPFSCDICKKSFPSKQELSGHMDRHSGNKPYERPKAFRDGPSLSNGINVHTEE